MLYSICVELMSPFVSIHLNASIATICSGLPAICNATLVLLPSLWWECTHLHTDSIAGKVMEGTSPISLSPSCPPLIRNIRMICIEGRLDKNRESLSSPPIPCHSFCIACTYTCSCIGMGEIGLSLKAHLCT